MAQHKFATINQFNTNKKFYLYEPEKYDCIDVDMQLIDIIIDNYTSEWSEIITYLGGTLEKFTGLDESGITIIPPESLNKIRNIVTDCNLKLQNKQLSDLLFKLDEAIINKMYIIHFGI